MAMTNIEKLKMNLAGKFWTRQNEMVEELEELDYIVEEINFAYVSVFDAQDEDETTYLLHLGHANSTMWVEEVEETF